MGGTLPSKVGGGDIVWPLAKVRGFVKVVMKTKQFNSVKPYGYFLVRKSDRMKYVGIRYANVKLNLTPSEDFGKVYFTSGRLKRQFKKDPNAFEYRVCRTFESLEEMWEWEKRIVLRVYRRKDWANQGWGTNFGENPDIGNLISQGKRAVGSDGKTSIERGADALREWLYTTEDGKADLESRSTRMRETWATKSEEEIAAWKSRRKENMDFKAASAKAAITRQTIGEDGITIAQRAARKATAKMQAEGTMSKIGKDRNLALNRKVGEMTDQEFEKFCEGKASCFVKGMTTRRNNYRKNQERVNELS